MKDASINTGNNAVAINAQIYFIFNLLLYNKLTPFASINLDPIFNLTKKRTCHTFSSFF